MPRPVPRLTLFVSCTVTLLLAACASTSAPDSTATPSPTPTRRMSYAPADPGHIGYGIIVVPGAVPADATQQEMYDAWLAYGDLQAQAQNTAAVDETAAARVATSSGIQQLAYNAAFMKKTSFEMYYRRAVSGKIYKKVYRARGRFYQVGTETRRALEIDSAATYPSLRYCVTNNPPLVDDTGRTVYPGYAEQVETDYFTLESGHLKVQSREVSYKHCSTVTASPTSATATATATASSVG